MNRANPNAGLISSWFQDKDFYSPAILTSPKKITSLGQKNCLNLFHQAAGHIPAYQDFLKKNSVHPKSIVSFSDFTAAVPLTTKENYIDAYPLTSRCWRGSLSGQSMISTSSGTTGQPHFWPRSLPDEIAGAYPHELIFDRLFSVRKKSTLVVNGFAMGNWIAGTFTSACVSLVAWKGYPITLMSPGYSLDAVLEILSNISSAFDQTIICGHNPFLKELIDAGTSQHLDWKKIHPKFLGTGQAVTESWRKYILKLTESDDYYHTFYNLYGSADASLMGFETPGSVYLRKIITESGLQKQIFGDERIPSLCSYDPRLTFFESINHELCITKNSGCPLIRYNIRDEGNLLSPAAVYQQIGRISASDKTALGPAVNWQLPLVYLFGRTKFMAKIYGANIYTEHVQHALDHESLQPFLTGRFILDTQDDDNHDTCLICHAELNPHHQPNPTIADLVQKTFIDQVRILNSEYNFILSNVGDKVKPRIILHSHGDEKFFPHDKVKKTA